MRRQLYQGHKEAREMKRVTLILISAFLLLFAPQRASAQWATFDASNLAQAVLSFLQDGDNMVINTEQFLQNLGVAKEQLEFLQEMDKRYREIRSDIYKVQDVIRIANNYEQMARMFTRYCERLKKVDSSTMNYYQTRSLVNEGFQYLLFASREVKRAREFLDSKSQVSEEERLKGLHECSKQVSRANAAMYSHIKASYETIDMAEEIVDTLDGLDEAFTIKYDKP